MVSFRHKHRPLLTDLKKKKKMRRLTSASPRFLRSRGMGGPMERLSAIVGLILEQGLDTFSSCSLLLGGTEHREDDDFYENFYQSFPARMGSHLSPQSYSRLSFCCQTELSKDMCENEALSYLAQPLMEGSSLESKVFLVSIFIFNLG